MPDLNPDDLSQRYENYRMEVNLIPQREEEREILQARELDQQAGFEDDLQEQLKSMDIEREEAPPTTERFLNNFFLRLPTNITKGGADAVNSTLKTIMGSERFEAANQWLDDNVPGLGAAADALDDGFDQFDKTSDKVVQDMSRFMLPFVTYMKLFGVAHTAQGFSATAGSDIVNALAADAVTSATALDPHMERLATVIQDLGVQSDFLAYLADTENETDAEGRFKNVIDNLGIGILGTALWFSARAVKSLWHSRQNMLDARDTIQQATEAAT